MIIALLALLPLAAHAQDAWTSAPRVAHAIARQAQAARPALPPVQEFIKRQYVEGIPYELASQYGPGDVPALLPMLHDQAFQWYWPNIVATLGAISSPNARDILIQFLEDGSGNIDAATYRAKNAVPMALGWLIFHRGDAKALAYLKDGTAPAFWASRIKWTLNGSSPSDNLPFDCMLGLGLTGDASARAVLARLQADASDARTKEIAQSAIQTLDTVKAKGLAGYYKR